MTQNMQNIWNGAIGALDGTISKYGDDFSTKFTAVQAVLSSIQANTVAMVEQSDNEAKGTVKDTKTTTTPSPSTTPSKPTTTSPTTPTEKTITVGGKINAKGAKFMIMQVIHLVKISILVMTRFIKCLMRKMDI